MLGLIKKDFLILKSNLKSFIIVFLVYFVMILQGMLDISFVLPFMGILLFISTFSYDDFNNWNAYANTLPNGRKNVVKAKYIATIILIVMLSLITILLLFAIEHVKNNNINFVEIMSSLMGTILSIVIIISLLYPIIFKVGARKGQIILFGVIFAIFAIGKILSQFIDMAYVINAIKLIENVWYIVIPLIVIILFSVSYFISNKIYQNKEF